MIAADRGASSGFRYGALLCLITISLVFQLAAPYTDLSRLITVLLLSATLMLTLWTSRARPVFVRVAAIVVGLAVAASIVAIVGGGETGKGATAIVALLVVGVAPFVIAAGMVRNVKEAGGVTLTTMFGVLCIYMLLGMLFSFAFGAVEAFGDEALFAQTDHPDQSDFLYYSFTTLTTTGFGDLTVSADLGRALTVIEALVGQIYLVTVVAAIVSNMRPRRG